jgi:IQ and ubiquitin-like domain-containing protein
MARPKKWDVGAEEFSKIHVETEFTKRADELRVLYHGLRTPLLTKEQRIEILLNVKLTVEEFDCKLSHDIMELVDREAHLLEIHGRSEQSLQGEIIISALY